MRNLAARAEQFQDYDIDMLGKGYTGRFDGDYTMQVWSDHLLAFMDAIGADSACLSGESLGAMVSAWTAIRQPQRVKKLVLNTGILAPPNAKGKQELIDALERSKKAAGNLTMDAVRARMAWLMAEPEKTLTDEVVAIRYAIYAQPGMQLHLG